MKTETSYQRLMNIYEQLWGLYSDLDCHENSVLKVEINQTLMFFHTIMRIMYSKNPNLKLVLPENYCSMIVMDQQMSVALDEFYAEEYPGFTAIVVDNLAQATEAAQAAESAQPIEPDQVVEPEHTQSIPVTTGNSAEYVCYAEGCPLEAVQLWEFQFSAYSATALCCRESSKATTRVEAHARGPDYRRSACPS